MVYTMSNTTKWKEWLYTMGRTKDPIVRHHKQYKEISGIDEVIEIPMSVHKAINHRELFPGLSAYELATITKRAHGRDRRSRLKLSKCFLNRKKNINYT